MIDLIAAAAIGGIIGFGVCAVLTAGKVADAVDTGVFKEVDGEMLPVSVEEMWDTAKFHQDNHTRCADELTTTQRKLSAIRDLLDKPRTIRKGELAMILDGEAA